MKKRSVICGALCALMLLTACQPTPDAPIVAGKDTEKMIEQAGKAGSADSLGASPDVLQAEIISKGGKLAVHANAAVTIPAAERYPVIKVGMARFSEEDVSRLFSALMGNDIPVANDAGETKAMAQRAVDELIKQRQAGILDKYDSLDVLDKAIADAVAEMENLPDEIEPIVPDLTFKELAQGGEEAFVRAIHNEQELSELRVYNSEEGLGFSRVQYYRDLHWAAAISGLLADPSGCSEKVQGMGLEGPSMPLAQASRLASETVEKLGLADFVCSASRLNAVYSETAGNAKGVYEFMYTRAIAGVPVTYTNDDGAVGKEENSYSKPWLYEKIHVVIDDDGILFFQWNSPYALGETVIESATLLPFEDIRNIFEKMIVIKDNYFDPKENGAVCNMHITDVRLGYMRVMEQNGGTSALLVPAWNFFGYSTYGDGPVSGTDGYMSLLAVNAIDGSIIDLTQGY